MNFFIFFFIFFTFFVFVKTNSLNLVKNPNFQPDKNTGQTWYSFQEVHQWQSYDPLESNDKKHAFLISNWRVQGYFHQNRSTLLQLNMNRNRVYRTQVDLTKGFYSISTIVCLKLNSQFTNLKQVIIRVSFCIQIFHLKLQDNMRQPQKRIIGHYRIQSDKKCNLKLEETDLQTEGVQVLISHFQVEKIEQLQAIQEKISKPGKRNNIRNIKMMANKFKLASRKK